MKQKLLFPALIAWCLVLAFIVFRYDPQPQKSVKFVESEAIPKMAIASTESYDLVIQCYGKKYFIEKIDDLEKEELRPVLKSMVFTYKDGCLDLPASMDRFLKNR